MPFQLSATELTSVQQKISDLKLFEQNTINTNTTHISQSPCDNYYLLVQNGATKQELTWDNCLDLLTVPEQDFVDFIIPLIEAHSEYKALPEATGGYL